MSLQLAAERLLLHGATNYRSRWLRIPGYTSRRTLARPSDSAANPGRRQYVCCLRQRSEFFPPLFGLCRTFGGKRTLASSIYHGLQLSARRNGWVTFQLSASYTYSHSIDDASSARRCQLRRFLQSGGEPRQLELRSAPRFQPELHLRSAVLQRVRTDPYAARRLAMVGYHSGSDRSALYRDERRRWSSDSGRQCRRGRWNRQRGFATGSYR